MRCAGAVQHGSNPGNMRYIDHADCTATTRQHEVDHTDHTDHTDQESLCLAWHTDHTALS